MSYDYICTLIATQCCMTEDTNIIIDHARKVFEAEIGCLEVVRENIDDRFAEAVRTIIESPGRIVLSGIGKSAIVAQKITATLNSTGSPALFMHAADAIHGDLGIIQQHDIVILLSKSGNSPEIKELVPYLKKMGNKIIALVSNLHSALAHDADIVLHVPVEREADPNNLAPTASTTAQMAMGDALAVSLLMARGFTEKDFARFHPGGNLGKQLYTVVGDVCRYNNKPSVASDAGIRDIIVTISAGRLGITAVEEGGRVVGVITDGDLRRMLEKEADTSEVKAKNIMTEKPKTIDSNELAINAMQRLKELNITQLIVMDGDRYAGVIHIHDLLREGFV